MQAVSDNLSCDMAKKRSGRYAIAHYHSTLLIIIILHMLYSSECFVKMVMIFILHILLVWKFSVPFTEGWRVANMYGATSPLESPNQSTCPSYPLLLPLLPLIFEMHPWLPSYSTSVPFNCMHLFCKCPSAGGGGRRLWVVARHKALWMGEQLVPDTYRAVSCLDPRT